MSLPEEESHFALDGQNYLELEEYLSNQDDEDIIFDCVLACRGIVVVSR